MNASPDAILTADEMRAAEQHAVVAGVSIAALMERAGTAVAEAVWRYGGGRPTLILCGPGNNGGDGYVAARVLAKRGVDVRIAALGVPKQGPAAEAASAWLGKVEPLSDATPPPIVIDAVFGTGLSGPLGAPLAAAIARIINGARFSLAVDVPSGVDTDNGSTLGASRVDMTLALGALKPAHVLQPSAGLCGHIRIGEIGVAAESPVMRLGKPALPLPHASDHKYSRGLVTVISGELPGAALLAALAAQRAGAGYVVLGGDEPPTGGTMALVHRSIDDAMLDKRTRVIILGPGIGRTPAARALIDQAIHADAALVLDADALHLIGEEDFRVFHRRTGPVVLTPHAGEFDALFGRGSGSKIDRARAAARLTGAKIIFKGADTVVASSDGRVAVGPSASHWLASAGTGDVLAGIVGAMLGQGLGAFEAATAAVWLHGEAARRAGPALIADDLCAHLPAAIGACQ